MQTRRNAVLESALFLWMAVSLVMVFFYAPIEAKQGIVQKIFYFHVPLAWNAFLGFFIVFIASFRYLATRDPKWDARAVAAAEVGVLFTTLVLITGPIWAKPTWGIWWTWDARLTLTLRPAMTLSGRVAFAGTASLVQAPTQNRQDLVTAIDRFQLQRATAIGSGILVALKAIFPDAEFDLRGSNPRGERSRACAVRA